MRLFDSRQLSADSLKPHLFLSLDIFRRFELRKEKSLFVNPLLAVSFNLLAAGAQPGDSLLAPFGDLLRLSFRTVMSIFLCGKGSARCFDGFNLFLLSLPAFG